MHTPLPAPLHPTPPTVVHLDTDSLVLQNMDELFSLEASLVYTCDYNMQNTNQRAQFKPCPVQGGFVVVTPSAEVFEGMVGVVRKGHWGGPYGSGWEGTGIGNWWGGPTFQGVVPYYYQKVADQARFPAVEVDRCVYNNMIDKPITDPAPLKGAEDCKGLPLHAIKNVRFKRPKLN